VTAHGPAAPPVEDGYPASGKARGRCRARFFPLISIIVALMLRKRKTRPRRRSQLTTWALAGDGLIVA
jgi:hypothetical protein